MKMDGLKAHSQADNAANPAPESERTGPTVTDRAENPQIYGSRACSRTGELEKIGLTSAGCDTPDAFCRRFAVASATVFGNLDGLTQGIKDLNAVDVRRAQIIVSFGDELPKSHSDLLCLHPQCRRRRRGESMLGALPQSTGGSNERSSMSLEEARCSHHQPQHLLQPLPTRWKGFRWEGVSPPSLEG